MASKDATKLELNISLSVELDSDARLELVEEIQKEWKKLLHETSIRILKLDQRDDGLRRVATRVTANPSLVDLKAQRALNDETDGLATLLELVQDNSERDSLSDCQAS